MTSPFAAAVAVAVGSAGMATAALASSSGGSPAAVRLARAVVNRQDRQVALWVRQSGGYYECPHAHGAPRIVLSARRPVRGCVPTSLWAKENLRHGAVTSSLLAHVARGRPTLYTLSVGARRWQRLQGRSCWTRMSKQPPVKQTITYAGEELAILGSGPKRVTLKGAAPGFVEIDILGARNHALLEAFDTVDTGRGIVHIHLSFGYPRSRFRLLPPVPLCR